MVVIYSMSRKQHSVVGRSKNSNCFVVVTKHAEDRGKNVPWGVGERTVWVQIPTSLCISRWIP